jgi:translation initiation factor IF-2
MLSEKNVRLSSVATQNAREATGDLDAVAIKIDIVKRMVDSARQKSIRPSSVAAQNATGATGDLDAVAINIDMIRMMMDKARRLRNAVFSSSPLHELIRLPINQQRVPVARVANAIE